MTAAAAVLTAGMRPAICETRMSTPDDLAFVVDSWTKNDPEMRKLRLGESTRHVRALLARPLSRLIIAHVPDEPDAILGWAATEAASGRNATPCLHYIYVRSAARRQGVARRMVGVVHDIEYTHVAPARWPPEGGAVGLPVVVPRGWVLNVGRAVT